MITVEPNAMLPAMNFNTNTLEIEAVGLLKLGSLKGIRLLVTNFRY